MPDQISRIDNLAAGRKARRAALRSQRQTPGAYIRECRQRARIGTLEVAEAICRQPGEYPGAIAALDALEDDQPGDYAHLVRAMSDHRAFPFDYATFCQLAADTAAPALGEMAA